MKLRQLIKDVPNLEVKGSKDIEIAGLACHSNCVAPGCLFIAKRGASFDGNRFIPEVIMSGAVAILSDVYDPSIKQVTQIIAKDVGRAEGDLAATFWGYPADELNLVGVTGTAGKTTTSYITHQLFSHFGKKSGLIGTVSYVAGKRECEASRTTPDVISNQRFLREVVKAGCEACVMEVTSHALCQGRVAHIDFDTAIFTNLTHEHLDYHKTMEAYAEAKSRLFSSLGKKKDPVAIYNAQAPFAQRIVGTPHARCFSYALDAPADLVAKEVNLLPQKTTFLLQFQKEVIPVTIPLMGRFNVYNTLAAASVFISRGYSLEEVAQGLEKIFPPPGRLERVENSKNLTIYVDYAHKEDALKNVLATIRESAPKKLILVFGCGGDRDKEKRSKMAQAAEKYADIVIVTSDNPRSENPETIIQEICAGFSHHEPLIIPDRHQAIEKAVSLATDKDIVLIAGKGHEKKQIFAQGTVLFDDCEVARTCCNKR